MAGPAPSFTQATPQDFAPSVFYGNRSPNDPAALLPDAAAVKMVALHQRAVDLFAQVPEFSEVQEASQARQQHADRISDLTKAKGEAGFGLGDDAPQVVAARRQLERAEKEFKRLSSLKEIRGARWNDAKRLETSVSDWLLRGGIPHGCVLEAVEDAPLSELLSKADNGRIDAGVERYRLRLRELAADLHRVKSAPWPSSVAKVAAREMIDRLADQGAPNLDGAIEFGQPISFASMMVTSTVRNVDTPAIAFAEIDNATGLLCWLFRDQMLAQIRIDEVADDKNALDEKARAELEAQIGNDMLAIERSECACIWHAEAKGEVIDFRPTTSPQSVLGVALRTQTRAVQSTSTAHAYDIGMPR